MERRGVATPGRGAWWWRVRGHLEVHNPKRSHKLVTASQGRRRPVQVGLRLGWFLPCYLEAAVAAGVAVTSGAAPLGCALFIPLLSKRPTSTAPTTAPIRIRIP